MFMRKDLMNAFVIRTMAASLLTILLHGVCFGQLIIRGGPAFATIGFPENEYFDYSMVYGFNAAAGYEISINSPHFSVVPEISFTRKGAKETFDTYFTTRFRSETETKIDYIEFPVLLRFTAGKGKVRPFANAGIGVSYGVGGKFSNTSMEQDPFPTGTPVYSSRKGSVKFGEAPDGPHDDELYVDNRFDYGIQAGAGVLLFSRVVVEMRYAMGLNDLYEPDNSLLRVMTPGKHRVFAFSAGYRFNLQK